MILGLIRNHKTALSILVSTILILRNQVNNPKLMH